MTQKELQFLEKAKYCLGDKADAEALLRDYRADNRFINAYKNHRFSTGPYAGEDYLEFQRKYKRRLSAKLKTIGWRLHGFHGNHYCFTAVAKNMDTGEFVFISVSDVRGGDISGEWYKNILYRTMKHQSDWTGGPNHYSTLEDLALNLFMLK